MGCGRGMETSSWQEAQPQPRAAPGLSAGCGHAPLGSFSSSRSAPSSALSTPLVLKPQAGVPRRLRCRQLSQALSALLLLVSMSTEHCNFVWFHYPWVYGDVSRRACYFTHVLHAYTTVPNVAILSTELCLALCQPRRSVRGGLTSRRTYTLQCSSERSARPDLAHGHYHGAEAGAEDCRWGTRACPAHAPSASDPCHAPDFHPDEGEGEPECLHFHLILRTTQKTVSHCFILQPR